MVAVHKTRPHRRRLPVAVQVATAKAFRRFRLVSYLPRHVAQAHLMGTEAAVMKAAGEGANHPAAYPPHSRYRRFHLRLPHAVQAQRYRLHQLPARLALESA
jgi:hypothetical protein